MFLTNGSDVALAAACGSRGRCGATGWRSAQTSPTKSGAAAEEGEEADSRARGGPISNLNYDVLGMSQRVKMNLGSQRAYYLTFDANMPFNPLLAPTSFNNKESCHRL